MVVMMAATVTTATSSSSSAVLLSSAVAAARRHPGHGHPAHTGVHCGYDDGVKARKRCRLNLTNDRGGSTVRPSSAPAFDSIELSPVFFDRLSVAATALHGEDRSSSILRFSRTSAGKSVGQVAMASESCSACSLPSTKTYKGDAASVHSAVSISPQTYSGMRRRPLTAPPPPGPAAQAVASLLLLPPSYSSGAPPPAGLSELGSSLLSSSASPAACSSSSSWSSCGGSEVLAYQVDHIYDVDRAPHKCSIQRAQQLGLGHRIPSMLSKIPRFPSSASSSCYSHNRDDSEDEEEDRGGDNRREVHRGAQQQQQKKTGKTARRGGRRRVRSASHVALGPGCYDVQRGVDYLTGYGRLGRRLVFSRERPHTTRGNTTTTTTTNHHNNNNNDSHHHQGVGGTASSSSGEKDDSKTTTTTSMRRKGPPRSEGTASGGTNSVASSSSSSSSTFRRPLTAPAGGSSSSSSSLLVFSRGGAACPPRFPEPALSECQRQLSSRGPWTDVKEIWDRKAYLNKDLPARPAPRLGFTYSTPYLNVDVLHKASLRASMLSSPQRYSSAFSAATQRFAGPLYQVHDSGLGPGHYITSGHSSIVSLHVKRPDRPSPFFRTIKATTSRHLHHHQSTTTTGHKNHHHHNDTVRAKTGPLALASSSWSLCYSEQPQYSKSKKGQEEEEEVVPLDWRPVPSAFKETRPFLLARQGMSFYRRDQRERLRRKALLSRDQCKGGEEEGQED